MKKLLSIAFCAAVGSAFASAYVGTVGVTAINSGAANTVVAVSYQEICPGGDVSVSNLVKTTNLTVGDQLARFNGTDYDTWSLVSAANGAKFWQKNSATFKVGADGSLTANTGTAADIATLSVGTGIWLCRQNYTTPFYLYGTLPDANKQKSSSVAGKWTLVGNPLQVSATLELANPGTSDQIVMPGSDGKLKYYNYKAGKGWRDNTSAKNALPPFPAGVGCWVKSDSVKTITWSPVD